MKKLVWKLIRHTQFNFKFFILKKMTNSNFDSVATGYIYQLPPDLLKFLETFFSVNFFQLKLLVK